MDSACRSPSFRVPRKIALRTVAVATLSKTSASLALDKACRSTVHTTVALHDETRYVPFSLTKGEDLHEEHPAFEAPDSQDAVIWRYMDLAKFVSLLEDEALFFTRSDRMSDTFEGTTTTPTLEASREWLGTAFDEFQRQMAKHRRDFRQHIYLSCWHMSEFESAAMWGLYQTAGHGIAIRSSYRRLAESLLCDDTIYIGTVKYVDFDKKVIDDSNAFYPFVHKRRSFEFERELRALAQHPPEELGDGTVRFGGESAGPPGLPLSVDLDHLVETIYVAPDAPSWFANLVRKIVTRYGRSWPVKQSDLSADPVY